MKIKLLIAIGCVLINITLVNAQHWEWANAGGGPKTTEAYGVTVDKHGNSYVTGRFQDSLKFGNTTLVANIGTNVYASDVFIAKYDLHGNLVWAKRAGGINYDYANAITVDTAGNIFITGLFIGTATFGTYSVTSISNDYDVFVAKYDTNGNALWVKSVGGNGWDVGSGITLDKLGNVIITGAYRNTGTFGTTTLTSAGNYDIFLAKYTSTGTFVWATGIGGTGDDRANSVSTDIADNFYITGFFNGAFTIGTTNVSSNGGSDILVAKFDGAGNPVWGKKCGGIHDDVGNSLAVSSTTEIYVTGYYTDTATFDTTHLNGLGNEDAFIAKYNYKGDVLWAKKYGGLQHDYGYGISLDTFNNVYATGSFWGAGTFDTISLNSFNQDDAFVLGIQNGTDKAKWVVNGGGLNIDVSRAIAASPYGRCFIAGYFTDNATFGEHTVTGHTNYDNDFFIAHLDSTFLIDTIPINSGITMLHKVGDVLIFPNPFKTSITVAMPADCKMLGVELFDVFGKHLNENIVIGATTFKAEKQEVIVDMSGLQKGMYMLLLKTDKGNYTSRLLQSE